MTLKQLAVQSLINYTTHEKNENEHHFHHFEPGLDSDGGEAMDVLVMTSEQPMSRWSLALQPYDFRVVYRSGKSNENADGLSRILTDDSTHDRVDKKGVECNGCHEPSVCRTLSVV